MIAIQTKWIEPTDTKGSRIKAFTSMGHQITVGWNSSLDVEPNHKAAALALCKKMGWTKEFSYPGIIGGGTKNGYAFVFVPKSVERAKVALGYIGAGERNGAAMGECSIALDALNEDFQ